MQKKLESELLQIEEKHRTKKCKFAENSEKFYEDLARYITCFVRITAVLI
jgi:hypothetical protein